MEPTLMPVRTPFSWLHTSLTKFWKSLKYPLLKPIIWLLLSTKPQER
jgi:hypothetical protein